MRAYSQPITNIEDVRKFFLYLQDCLRLNFHPDTDFADYVKITTGDPSFSRKEVANYNSLMDQCFAVCETTKTDIHAIALEIMRTD